jgi:hypothetical protein
MGQIGVGEEEGFRDDKNVTHFHIVLLAVSGIHWKQLTLLFVVKRHVHTCSRR